MTINMFLSEGKLEGEGNEGFRKFVDLRQMKGILDKTALSNLKLVFSVYLWDYKTNRSEIGKASNIHHKDKCNLIRNFCQENCK
jgi:hypothetical protein